MTILEQIQIDEIYQQVIKDSYGGIMYTASNRYDANHLIELWNSMTLAEQENAGGIVTGAIAFIKDQG